MYPSPHQVVEDLPRHKAPVEPVAILIEIVLKVLHVVVHPPQLCFEHHYRPVQFREVVPLLSRWYPFHFLEILFQRPLAAPLVGVH